MQCEGGRYSTRNTHIPLNPKIFSEMAQLSRLFLQVCLLCAFLVDGATSEVEYDAIIVGYVAIRPKM